jgi:hypothetical protein
MDLKSLAQKIEQKIAASSDLDLALQEYDAELGHLAINCVQNAKTAESTLPEKILNKVKDIAQRPYANTMALSAITGLGGAAAGGLLGGNLVSKKELESRSDFEKRKRDTALIGALAGGALGAGTPGILNAVGALGSEPPSLVDRAKDYFNPLAVGTGAAVGQGAWILGAKPWLNAKMMDKAQAQLNLLEKGGLKGGAKWMEVIKKIDPQNPMFNRLALTDAGQAPGFSQKIKEFLTSRIGPKNYSSYATTGSAVERAIADGIKRPKLRAITGFLPAILGGIAGQQIADITE